MIHRELLEHSPLLALPLAATVLFVAVWLFATVRAMTRPGAEIAEAARIPLDRDVRSSGRGGAS